VEAGKGTVAAPQGTPAVPQSAVAPPQIAVNQPSPPPSPRATAPAVSHPSHARSELLELHTRAERRELAAASLYTSAEPVLRRQSASVPAREAKAALAGVRAATDRIAGYAAAADRAAPDRLDTLLHDARGADREAAAHDRRLRAAVARARALAEAPASPSPSPSTGPLAASPVEAASPAPRRAPPAAPLSEDDRRRYTAAVHSYRHADGCYRDLVGALSRVYGTGPADAERNRELSRRVRALYERLRALEGTLGTFEGAGANGDLRLQQFDLQVHDYLAQCHATRRALEDSAR
jgi:hypothetical protein